MTDSKPSLNYLISNLNQNPAIEKKLNLFYDVSFVPFDMSHLPEFSDIDFVLRYFSKILPVNTVVDFNVLNVDNKFIIDFRNKAILKEFEEDIACSWNSYLIYNNGKEILVYSNEIKGLLSKSKNDGSDSFESLFIPNEYMSSFKNGMFSTLAELEKAGFKASVDARLKSVNNFVNEIYNFKI